MANVDRHQGELYPCVGFLLTDLRRPAERVVRCYNGRDIPEQWIKEGQQALRWTRLSCHSFRDNAVRLQLFALAYNLVNFPRTLALPGEMACRGHCSPRSCGASIGCAARRCRRREAAERGRGSRAERYAPKGDERQPHPSLE